jgi:hypothetical protein
MSRCSAEGLSRPNDQKIRLHERLQVHADAHEIVWNPMIYVSLIGLILFGVQADQTCDLVPSTLLQEPVLRFTGLYTNESFGYSIKLPDGVQGYDDPDAATHHGFGLVTGDKPQSYTFVEGRANSLEYRTARQGGDQFVRYLRDDGKAIESVAVKRSTLGSLPAVQVVVTYTCRRMQYIAASRFALSPQKDLEFQVTLYALANRFERDRVVFDQLLKSWSYNRPSR